MTAQRTYSADDQDGERGEAAAAGRFVWPPREPVRDPAEHGAGAKGQRHGEGGGARASIDTLSPVQERLAVLAATQGVWEQIEEAWLGLEAARLDGRMRETGWAPDSPESSCGRCGRWAGPFDAGADGCSRCRGTRLPWRAMVRVGGYVPPLSAWVREVKFRRQRVLGLDLGRMLGERIVARLAAERLRPSRVYLVPVPTSPWNRMSRGIDHPLHIARGAAHVVGATVCSVLRRKHGWSQTALPASERAANAARGIGVRWLPLWLARGPGWGARLLPAAAVWGATGDDLVVVVDDILTTGATLEAACKGIVRAYKRLGRPMPWIWAAAVAVTPSAEERGRMQGGAAVFGE